MNKTHFLFAFALLISASNHNAWCMELVEEGEEKEIFMKLSKMKKEQREERTRNLKLFEIVSEDPNYEEDMKNYTLGNIRLYDNNENCPNPNLNNYLLSLEKLYSFSKKMLELEKDLVGKHLSKRSEE